MFGKRNVPKYLFILFLSLVFGYSVCLANSRAKPESLSIDLQDFTIGFSKIVVDEHYNFEVKAIGKDTVFVRLELGDTIEGSEISIASDSVEAAYVFQRYETSITVMNEGPHLDLLDWKHFISDWVKLQAPTEGKFKAISYGEDDWARFPEVTASEIKQAVLEYGGQSWADLVSGITSITDQPIGIGISKILLRVEYSRNGKRFQKTLIFEVPMGC